jgi:hypothetical protein
MKHLQTFESFLNEAATYELVWDGFDITLSNIKKTGKEITADAVMNFETARDIDPFLENELDEYNQAILDWASDEGIIKGNYTVNFDWEDYTSYRVDDKQVTGTMYFRKA